MENHLNVITQALDKATKSGSFGLAETEGILNAVKGLASEITELTSDNKELRKKIEVLKVPVKSVTPADMTKEPKRLKK